MFLKSIHIENVCCIRDMEISFETEAGPNRKWTIIVGENGSGKSTILKCIAFLLGGSDAWAELFHDSDDWISNDAESCSISAVLTTAKAEERLVSVVMERGDTLRTLYHRNEKSMEALDRALEHTDRSYLTIGYGVSRRLSNKIFGGISEQEFEHPRAQAVTTLFSPNVPLVSFETWAFRLHDQRASDAINMVHDAMHGLLPGVDFDGFDQKQRLLMFNTPDGLVPLRKLSDGYRNVIGWVGDLLSKIVHTFGDFKSPLDSRGLLLIDELDLHLHPGWQRRLIDFLTEKLPHLQLIVTTNSPMLAHQARENELHFIRRDNHKNGPQLHHFVGCPHKLLLHQLIISPVFGVETANSNVVEQHRGELELLASKDKLTTVERKRLKYVQASLQDVTHWNEATEQGQQLQNLLSRIEEKLPK